LPAGTYDVSASLSATPTTANGANYKSRLFNTTAGAVILDIGGNDLVSLTAFAPNIEVPCVMTIDGRFTLAFSSQIKFQTYSITGGGGASAAGFPASSGEPEVYLNARFVKVG